MKSGLKSFLCFPTMNQNYIRTTTMRILVKSLERLGYEGMHFMVKRVNKPMKMWMYGRIV